MKAIHALCTAAIVAIALPQAALAENGASQSFGVSARVPAYCEINASAIVVSEGNGTATGTVFESCNTQEGFQVVASHRPLEANEWVAFNYAGNASYLQPHGWSQVANRVGAKHGVRPISVQYSGLATPLAISLTITSF